MIIGLLTCARPGKAFIGNIETFERLSAVLQEMGAVVFVFTPECISTDSVRGYMYLSKSNQWKSSSFRYPDFVYNRIPFRKDEESEAVQKTFEWLGENGIRYFNRRFFQKWDVYQTLRNDPWLHHFIPDTQLLETKERLDNFIQTHHEIYCKSIKGHKGNGIFTISSNKDRSYSLRTTCEKIDAFESIDELWEFVTAFVGEKTYLIQRKIKLREYKGNPYDFRLLVQKVNHEWQLTGVGIRCASSNSITTHVPKGGTILNEEMLPVPIDKELFQKLSKAIGEQLDTRYGPLGEFSLDIGQDKAGDYWLFEANSKPMIFDEPHIQQKGMNSLISAILQQIL
jgi:glutathione synthase/RimK-type ligase-like ATP-grasp enzyme